jgi:hypothetical protein
MSCALRCGDVFSIGVPSVLFLLALSCLAAATLGSVVVYQRGAQARLAGGGTTAALPPASRHDEEPAPTVDKHAETLELGDVVSEGADDWVVCGTCVYREERDVWWLHVLDGGSRQKLLDVRRAARGGPWEAAFLEPVDDAPLFGQLYSGLTYRGLPFTLQARGDARVTTFGDVLGRLDGLLKYTTYAGPGGAVLVIEEEGAIRRAYFGRKVPSSSLSFMPGERPADA